MQEWESSDSEKEEEEEDDKDGNIAGGLAAPPLCTELSKHLSLETYAAGCALDEASYLLTRARMNIDDRGACIKATTPD